MENLKYENIPVICKAHGDYKALCFVSGNSKSEVIKNIKTKHRLNVRMNGLIWVDHPDFPKAINSNKL